MAYTLGILDEEESQIDLIRTCFEDNFNIVEIGIVKNISDLIKIIHSEKIDIISIDYKLKDHNKGFLFNGDYFFKELWNMFGDFPAFILTQNVDSAKKESKKINPRFIVDKAKIHQYIDPKNKEDKLQFVTDLEYEITAHRNNVSDNIKEIKLLQDKIDDRKLLTGTEENRYIELNNKLSKSISGYNTVSQSYFSSSTNDRLDILIRQTEELLKKLE